MSRFDVRLADEGLMELPPEASAVALQVAGSMVSTMFTTAWNAVSRRFAKTVGGDDSAEEERIIARLDRDQQRLRKTDAQSRTAVEEVVTESWTDTLVDLLALNPERVTDLRTLLSDMDAVPRAIQIDESVTQVARADGFGNTVNQVGKNQFNLGPGQR